MKESEVPQDLNYYRGTLVRDLNYAVDEQGRYKAVVSEGWKAKEDALDVTWAAIREECEQILEQIRRGELSPLAYHAKKNLMSIELLSDYTGISKRKIRKHLEPKNFAKLDKDTLEVYADALRITVDELTSVPE